MAAACAQAVGLSARTEQPATQPGGAPAVPSASVHAADNASIVRLDLDRDAARQTVVDREEGVYLGHVSTPEPFGKLFNQGYIQAFAYTDARGAYVPAAEVVERDGKFYLDGTEVFQEFGKIGKSLKNSISPDEICDEYGADTLRVYEMSMGPLEIFKAEPGA